MSPLRRLLAALALGLLATPPAWAFDLDQLGARLATQAVVRGPFVQEKHLRALERPLTSRGQFVLSAEHGLLWQLRSPLQLDYRIDRAGVARHTGSGWQALPGQDMAAQQSRLFLALLRGDRSGLERDFDLRLSGSGEAWTLRLTPRALLLRQVFSAIHIQGGAQVERIELLETQGDRTLLRLPQSRADVALQAQERDAFAP
ncbi:outer membrane lipoprotein carrier protein LolA [Pseudomonas lalucatii]|uniref:Outer membrane lipoprotein carrier protein LolA n=1 Tax=Pseudomonas lalucatii TaxID=1424203 RepID=A0ABS5Q1X9_9PSED|nr:outer membrane lipoprotein carrier protein LolA [Pseudomonas lalucatii]MBS7662298.1 outer membrane lipoprotein carrier protein LolA [Pseudomonas lalucatii]MBS7690366.1 outer membrane lipoprotein carrier protein LolA [Pseudomonas lalucatii]